MKQGNIWYMDHIIWAISSIWYRWGLNVEIDKRQKDWARQLFIIQEALMMKGHPMQQNGWGNRNMIIEDPKSRGIDSYEALQEWYPLHYSSNWMNLCVQSADTLDHMETYVRSIFSAIPKRHGLERPKTNPYTESNALSLFKTNRPKLIRHVPGVLNEFIYFELMNLINLISNQFLCFYQPNVPYGSYRMVHGVLMGRM